MADLLTPIQNALLAALAGMTAPGKTGGTVNVACYSDRPRDAGMPFVAVDGTSFVPDDVMDADIVRTSTVLSVWSEYPGHAQVNAILGAMRDRLHYVTLVLSTGQSISCRVTALLTQREQDNVSYHGTMTIEVIAAFEEA